MAENDDGGSPAAAAATAATDIPSTSASNTARLSAESSTSTSTEQKETIPSGHELEGHDDDAQGEREPEGEKEKEKQEEEKEEEEAPPLPDEEVPPLPDEVPPGAANTDDGWEPVWDANAQAYYFYNRITGVSQWENPRVPAEPAAPGTETEASAAEQERHPAGVVAAVGGYNPAIHGDYDPSAPYAQQYEQDAQAVVGHGGGGNVAGDYTAHGTFNRFTGRWQAASLTPENFNDENKSRRQMHAYFDVDAAANSHNGRSLKAERSGKKLTKAEVKAFREKRRERKEEKRRAWLRD